MPVSMAIRRPQRRASYSAMLFDAGKCRHTTYLMCSPRGEIKSRLAPAPVFIINPSSRGSNTRLGFVTGAIACSSIRRRNL
jgi:hypothetical protein